jgi:hypothetical protein
MPPPLPSARFFPRLDEQEGAPVDPLENPRVDLLGVRTAQGDEEKAAPIVRDQAMERASTEEPLVPKLPLVLKISGSHAGPEGPMAQAAEVVLAKVDSPSVPPGVAPLQAGQAIALEYADDLVLAGRPRLGNDGRVRPGPKSSGDPTRYGPDPTYPAAYYPGGSAPTSVPKNREVWPVLRPWRPTLLPRVWRRISEAVTGTATPASRAVGEPHNIAETGQGVERVVANGLDEATER